MIVPYCDCSIALVSVVVVSILYGFYVHRLTGHLQLFASKMAEKAILFKHERQKANDLLHQMLPKSVAQQLIIGKVMHAYNSCVRVGCVNSIFACFFH